MTTLLLFAMFASAADVSLPLAFRRQHNAMTVVVAVNGKPCRFLIDTGPAVTDKLCSGG